MQIAHNKDAHCKLCKFQSLMNSESYFRINVDIDSLKFNCALRRYSKGTLINRPLTLRDNVTNASLKQ